MHLRMQPVGAKTGAGKSGILMPTLRRVMPGATYLGVYSIAIACSYDNATTVGLCNRGGGDKGRKPGRAQRGVSAVVLCMQGSWSRLVEAWGYFCESVRLWPTVRRCMDLKSWI
jgi:hypothetical protein